MKLEKNIYTVLLTITIIDIVDLTITVNTFMSYRNQCNNLLCRSIDWFLYDRNLLHGRVNYFHKKLHLRCLTGLRLKRILNFISYNNVFQFHWNEALYQRCYNILLFRIALNIVLFRSLRQVAKIHWSKGIIGTFLKHCA